MVGAVGIEQNTHGILNDFNDLHGNLENIFLLIRNDSGVVETPVAAFCRLAGATTACVSMVCLTGTWDTTYNLASGTCEEIDF